MKNFIFLMLVLVVGVLPQPVQSQSVALENLPLPIRTAIQDYQQGELSKHEAISEVRAALEAHTHQENGLPIKCGNPLLHALEVSGDEFFALAPQKSAGTGSPEIASFYMSPSGKFRFEYYITGTDSVWTYDLNTNGIPDYVERAGIEMDAIWDFQITELGFRDPLEMITPYPIQFKRLDYYGHTESNGRKIVINSTFKGLDENTDPEDKFIGALKVTLAHEFKHAIQYMYNRFSGDSHRWAEMDATLLEEVSYDEVNDYYNYIVSSGSLFRNPETTVNPGSYEDITFALYFHEKFGPLFWTNVWNRTVNGTPNFLVAIDEELQSVGSNLEQAYAEMALWHTFSGSRAVEGFGFDEARFYPNISRKTALRANMTQFQPVQTARAFTFHALPIAASGNVGSVNLGLKTSGALNTVISLGFKANPTWKTYEHTATEQVHFSLFEDNLLWTQTDTVWVVLSNASRVNPITYQVLNSTDSNPGLFSWGDIDDSGNLNSGDVRIGMKSVLNQQQPSSFALFGSDITRNGQLSGLDLAFLLEVINGKRSNLEIDVNSDSKWPELSQFRLSAEAKEVVVTDSLLFSLIPLDGSDQTDTRLQLSVNYSQEPFIRSLMGSLPVDTALFSVIALVKDDYISTAELDWHYTEDGIQFILIHDEVIPSGAILELDLNRKSEVKKYGFSLKNIVADEFTTLLKNTPEVEIELPTRIGVFTEKVIPLTEIPAKTQLLPAFPNPFNPTTTLRYELSKPGNITLEVYSVTGQLIQRVQNGFQPVGVHHIQFNANGLASGVYVVRFESDGFQQHQKLMLVK